MLKVIDLISLRFLLTRDIGRFDYHLSELFFCYDKNRRITLRCSNDFDIFKNLSNCGRLFYFFGFNIFLFVFLIWRSRFDKCSSCCFFNFFIFFCYYIINYSIVDILLVFNM